MKKNQVRIVFTANVETVYPDKKVKHGKFERNMESLLKAMFFEIMKMKVAQVSKDDNYEWRQASKNAYEYVHKLP